MPRLTPHEFVWVHLATGVLAAFSIFFFFFLHIVCVGCEENLEIFIVFEFFGERRENCLVVNSGYSYYNATPCAAGPFTKLQTSFLFNHCYCDILHHRRSPSPPPPSPNESKNLHSLLAEKNTFIFHGFNTWTWWMISVSIATSSDVAIYLYIFTSRNWTNDRVRAAAEERNAPKHTNNCLENISVFESVVVCEAERERKILRDAHGCVERIVSFDFKNPVLL